MTRLNKLLAHNLGISRREADDMIIRGEVTVDGHKAELGQQVDPSDQAIVALGKPLSSSHDYTYLAMHKPVGYVCSRRQQGSSPTIYELLPQRYHHLKTVGRLDRDSSGLIILTDDGDFAHRMTHPRYAKSKIYEVTLDHPLEPLHHQMIVDHGVILPDGPSRFSVETMGDNQYRVTMHEGRNRQIRRTFAALGYTVTDLHRVTFGNYAIEDIESGQTREIAVTQI